MREAPVPVTREVCVTIAFESFLRCRLEMDTYVTCLLQVPYQVHYRSGVAQNTMLKALESPKISLFAVFVLILIPA